MQCVSLLAVMLSTALCRVWVMGFGN
jgi:hypothetical protein